MQHPVKDAVIAAAVSVGGASASFFVKTLPVVQWGAAAVAIVAGLTTITIGLTKLHSWLKSRKS